MRSKLFREKPKTVQTGRERWVQIVPGDRYSYRLYDPVQEMELGSILFDEAGHWIYDGRILFIDEQEDVAAAISGNQKEMDDLLSSLR